MQHKFGSFVLPLFTAILIASPLFANELDSICPERVPGEFIVEFDHSITARRLTTSTRASLVRDAFRYYPVEESRSLRKGSRSVREVAVVKKTQSVAEEDLYTMLKNDAQIRSVSPNCIRRRLNAPKVVSGKVIELGGEEFDLPILSFNSTQPNRIMSFAPDLSTGLSRVYEPEGSTKIAYQESNSLYSLRAAGSKLLVAAMNRSYQLPNGSAYPTCAVGGFSPSGEAGNWDSLLIPLEGLISHPAPYCVSAAGDVTGDGVSELVVAAAGYMYTNVNTVVVFINELQEQRTFHFHHSPYQVAIKDMNGDGRGDIVALTREPSGLLTHRYHLEIARSLGGGSFAAPVKFDATFPTVSDSAEQMALGDIDRDGREDVLLLGGRRVWILWGNGNIGFSNTTSFELTNVNGWFFYIAEKAAHLVDLDNDGWLDIFASTTENIVTLKNVNGSFPYYMEHTQYPAYDYFDFSDINGDGYLDVIASEIGGSSPGVFFNNLSQHSITQYFPSNFLEVPSSYQVAAPSQVDGKPHVHRTKVAFEALVELRNISTPSVVYRTRVGGDGMFRFVNVPSGQYTLEVIDAFGQLSRGTQVVNVTHESVLDLLIEVRRDVLPPPMTFQGSYSLNDPGAGYLWSHYQSNNIDMDIDEAWSEYGVGDASLVVAVVDDGYEHTHPDLSAGAWRNPREIPDNDIDDDGNGWIDDLHGVDTADEFSDPHPGTPSNSHGTHVSGTVNATANNNRGIAGAAPGVKVMGVKVFSSSGGGASDDDILEGLSYALEQRRAGVNLRVLNMSLGSQGICSSPYVAILGELARAGVSVIVAAGNDNSDNDVTSATPANCPTDGLISVAAIAKNGSKADFSNYGATKVHVAAPGVEILSTFPEGWPEVPETGYSLLKGTSMAAPNVAGVVALLYSSFPELQPGSAKSVLMSTVKPLSGLQGKVVAAGVVSAKRALDKLAEVGTGSGGGGSGSGSGNGTGTGDGGGSSVLKQLRELQGLLTGAITDAKKKLPTPDDVKNATGTKKKKLVQKRKIIRLSQKIIAEVLREMESIVQAHPKIASTLGLDAARIQQMKKALKDGKKAKSPKARKMAWTMLYQLNS